MKKRRSLVLFGALLLLFTDLFPQPAPQGEKTLMLVSTAHFDTQWRWTVRTSIEEYLKNTLEQNFALLRKYPFYLFNFEGAIKYMWIREYYPEAFDTLKKYLREGRWNICGSSLDAGDVNIPSPEAILRNILTGQQFYKKEFGTTSCDIFLPDCFGFGYALPAIASHCGLKGFSTQKLSWRSAVEIPFHLGLWQGVDGSKIPAVLDARPYNRHLTGDASNNKEFIDLVAATGKQTGLNLAYVYYGTGDRGGSPTEESVQWLGKSLNGEGPLKVVTAPADQLFRQLTPAQISSFPVYNGELLMTFHGTGCYTAQGTLKRWNRKNELLALAAEKASVIADWLGAVPYPSAALNDAWIRFLWHQFHDDLTGTSIREAYEFSWNDEAIAMNRSGSILENACGAIARGLNTRGTGIPVVVFNPVSFDRPDVITVTINRESKWIRVLDSSYREIPSQLLSCGNGKTTFCFTAKVPAIGFSVYDVQAWDHPIASSPVKNPLKVDSGLIENEYYRVLINKEGDVYSIYDKRYKKEILSAPLQFQMLNDTSSDYPAWEILYNTVAAAPRAFVDEVVKIEITEKGPVRASLKITRKKEESWFVQSIRLASGSERIEFDNEVQWNTRGTLLKAVFPFTVSNPYATYDLGCGTIKRQNNTPRLYEVPAQQWASITDKNGTYGVSVLSDCKYGWDKPADNILRLTLLHTPATANQRFADQQDLDLGRHRFGFAIVGHAGDWRKGKVVRQAEFFNQPLLAFESRPFDGALGKSFSFVSLSTPQVIVRALKKAENSNEIILRLQEINGENVKAVKVRFPLRILSVREVTGTEDSLRKMTLADSFLVLSFKPYQLRTFALTLASPSERVSPAQSIDLNLDYNLDAVSSDSNRQDGNIIDGKTLPAEQFPQWIEYNGIKFRMGLKTDGRLNAMMCRGDKIRLPQIQYKTIYLLAASKKDDVLASFKIDGQYYPLYIRSLFEPVGRAETLSFMPLPAGSQWPGYHAISNAYIKRENIAWYATHLHDGYSGKNIPYAFGYLFFYRIDLPEKATELVLPDNEDVVIFAMSMGKNYNEWTRPACDIYERADVLPPLGYTTSANSTVFEDKITLSLFTRKPGENIYYTTDNTSPTVFSSLYTHPLTFDQTTIVRAITFPSEAATGYEITIPLIKGKCQPAVNYSNPVPGIETYLYSGNWTQLPLFDTLTPVETFVFPSPVIPAGWQGKDHFALRCRGFISIPADGMYVFSLTSDDGSRLSIDNAEVVVHDGIHGAIEKQGTVLLKKGLHLLNIEYFEATGGEVLQVSMQGPGMKKQPLPPSMLFRRKTLTY